MLVPILGALAVALGMAAYQDGKTVDASDAGDAGDAGDAVKSKPAKPVKKAKPLSEAEAYAKGKLDAESAASEKAKADSAIEKKIADGIAAKLAEAKALVGGE